MPCSTCTNEARCDRLGLCQDFAKKELDVPKAAERDCVAPTGCWWPRCSCEIPAARVNGGYSHQGYDATMAPDGVTVLPGQQEKAQCTYPRCICQVRWDTWEGCKAQAASGVLVDAEARHCGNCTDGTPGGHDNCAKCGREQQYSHWTPRFQKTFCSQCSGEFGPGDQGYSHCEDHGGEP